MSKRGAVPTDLSLRVSASELNKFNQNLARRLVGALGFEPPHYLFFQKLGEDPSAPELDYGLVASGRELTAIDDRGTEQTVIHLQSSPNLQQHLLLAINFSWARTSKAFRFSQAQVLVFLAWGDAQVARTLAANRRQLLRLEWEGVDAKGVFGSGVAAHPHWNMDQWLTGHDPEWIRAEARLTRGEDLREFGSNAEENAPPNIRWIRSIHFAAAAQWARTPWITDQDCSMHAAGPIDLRALENWTLSALRYISHQFRAAIERVG